MTSGTPSSRPEGWARWAWEALRDGGDEPSDAPLEDTFILGRLAIEGRGIERSALEDCLREQRQSRGRLGDLLVRSGLLGPEELSRLRAEHKLRSEGVPVLSRFEVGDKLGEGTTAVVYRTWDRQLQRWVALKVLRESVALSEIGRERFRREALAAAALSHPHLVAVYDSGEHDGRLYLVMEMVEGRSLGVLLRERRPEAAAWVTLLEKIARGVAAAHAAGIVHRDLKPGNIIVSSAGEPKVGDFGLAHLSDSDAGLTRTGVTLGTPAYMAPEQVEGRAGDVSPRTDVYALGAVLYEGLAGRPPHGGESVAEIFGKIAREEPASLRTLRSGIPRELEAIVFKALERDPARRYADAGLFADDLARWLRGEQPKASPQTTWTRTGRVLLRHRLRILAATVLLVAASAWAIRERALADYQRSFQRGLDRWERGLAVDASELFREASRQRPSRPEPWLMIGRCERARGRTAEAAQAWTRALELDPGFSPARFERGKLAMDEYIRERPPPAVSIRAGRTRAAAGKPDDTGAEADLSDAKGLEPAERAYLEGARSFGQGRYAEAATSLAEYVRHHGRDGPAAALAGAAAYYAGNPAAAEAHLSDAVRLEGRPAWFKARGDARYLQGKHAEALADYTEADAPDAKGLALQGLGRFDQAIAEHTLALQRNPRRAETWNNRGTARAAAKDFDGAEEDLERALQLRPLYADAFNNLGTVRLLRGRFEEALTDYDAALGIDPSYEEAYLNRAKARRLKGDVAGARADVRKALDVAPPGWLGRAEAELLLGN
jgi:tetratricopeptide (TPR) repeat protein/tRNA A-37 threonylcarbamoyl transferase component Bud32